MSNSLPCLAGNQSIERMNQEAIYTARANPHRFYDRAQGLTAV